MGVEGESYGIPVTSASVCQHILQAKELDDVDVLEWRADKVLLASQGGVSDADGLTIG